MILSGSKIYTILAIIASIGLLGLSNCKPPDEPFDDSNEPVFALKGTLDGSPIQLIAGVNGYYMFTNYTRPANDSIYRFSGTLSVDSCLNCESINITIGDASTSFGMGQIDIENALSANIILADPSQIQSKSYTLNFVAEDSGYVSPRYRWQFGNGDSSLVKNPTYTFNDTSRNVCLTISEANGSCSNTICNTVKPFEVDKGDSITPIFDFGLNKTVIFRNSSFGLSYLWDFGDGNTSIAYQPEHKYTSPGTYRVCVRVRTINAIHTYCRSVVINDPSFTCLSNFSYNNPRVINTPTSFISKAIITYTAENGDTYRSNLAIQPASSFFNIISNRSYLLNEKGEKTQQVNLTFKCRVFNTNNSSDFKDLEITDGVIAIAHP